MQAHRGADAEAEQQRWAGGRHVVVRAIVDQTTQRAALLLADSSCLLVSLAGRSGLVPITVPGPCSDACFLRLQTYWPAGAALSASGFGRKFGNSLSPSLSKVGFGEDVERVALRIGQGESLVSWVQELREKKSAGKLSGGGKAKGQGFGGVRREFFVVTAHPAKGGSCTDLRAWSCVDPAFACADIELELGDKRVRVRDSLHNFPSRRALARLDAPHGVGVKMAASINVLIVYSSSAGKLWVMVGKGSDQMGGSAQTVIDKDVFGAEGYEKKCLVLTKCAIVSCHGPVYSIHVSPLHLFLGENNGVRVWLLRPLIKPGSSGKSCGQSKSRLHVNPEQGSYQSNKTLDCERCERGDRCQHVTESSNASARITEKTCIGNWAHLDENLDSRDSMGVSAMKGLPRKGLFSTGEVYLGACDAGIGNYRKPQVGPGAHSRVSTSEFRSLSGLQEALKSDSSSENLSAEDDMTGKKTMGNRGGGVIKNETRNGISRSYPAEYGGVSIKEILSFTKSYGPQGDLIFSITEALLPNECTNNYPLKTAPRPRNGLTPVAESQLVISQVGALPVASQLAIKKVIQQSGSRVQSKTNMNSGGMWFVALNSEKEGGVVTTQCTSHAYPRPSPQLQVVDMQGLSLKEYLVLDSNGELHLLTLHEVSEERKLESRGRASSTLRHLQITMRVASFAVLPLPPPFLEAHRDLVSPAAVTAKRKLWISDGMYSVHIVILPEEKTKGSIFSSTAQATLAVSQAVFMKDRVDGLVAGCQDTVIVLAKGKLFSYVMPGA